MIEAGAIPKRTQFLPEPARILDARDLTARERLFRLRMETRPLGHRPCQFVEVSIAGIGEAPISVTSAPSDDDSFELCVRRVGSVTGAMHRLGPGDRLGIRGPYGNGFPLERIDGRDLLFVCGGLGLAPLRSLILHCLAHRSRFGRLVVLYGARTPAERLYREELASWEEDGRIELHQTVDRPDATWEGKVGVITTLFGGIEVDPLATVAVVVGPPVMYKYAVLELLERGIMESRIFLSLERRMRCGLGKCGHCQMNGIYVCREGPVFCYSDVKRVAEALG